jgi:AraC family transcriptional regulator of adaptative response/methylated-DNA-[protein]-cysteine methyltransferase
MMTSVDTRRWRSFSRRDKSADGNFIVAVKTTGIYCRPSCPARRPLRQNVKFYATPADARRAGFRACKRCKPDAAGPDREHADAVARACRVITQSESPPHLETLAQAAGMSPSHFHRVFKSQTGVTPRAYAAAHRARRLRHELSNGKSVTSAIHRSGFSSSGRFYTDSDTVLGMTPTAFRAGGKGETIRYAAGRCALGLVLVAATERGVCFIAMGDERNALLRDLQHRFPRADVVPADKAFARLVAKVVAFVERPAVGLDLPLDIRGTAFQQRVWQKLCEIPLGSTRTYAQIARAVGKPKAIRAVGQACAANPISLAIPCHRVVRGDGSLSGYYWGAGRKAKLLEAERS